MIAYTSLLINSVKILPLYVLYSSVEANTKLTVSNQLGMVTWSCTKTTSELVKAFSIENLTKILAVYMLTCEEMNG